MASQETETLAISIAKKCTKSKNENGMALISLPLEKSPTIANRYSFGRPHLYIPSKTILLMGATGSGKTTWINAMINYALGVEWDYPFRFVLVEENLRGGSQSHSQTQGVNVYDIHPQNGFRIPFALTIVDTPGFGDTQGIGRDKEITSAIHDFFKHQNGIQELDAVGFVVQSGSTRLTPTQEYIFKSVFSIFGKDVEENVRFLVTFADGTTPSVLKVIKDAKLLCRRMDSKGSPCYQKFNNGAIYVNNQDEKDELSPIEWKNGMKNFKLFFDELSEMSTKSLQMTQEVLVNRKEMELKLQWMQNAIPKHLNQIEELRKKEAICELYKAEINANKNFKIKVQVSKNVKESIDRSALNCTICEMTCQTNCNSNALSQAFSKIPPAMLAAAIPVAAAIPLDMALVCAKLVVDAITDPECKVCGCINTKHEKGEFRWVIKNVEETQTLQHMKESYEAAKGEKMNAEQLVKALRKDVDDQKKKIVKEIETIKDLHNNLKKNALHGNPLSTPEYIRMMIENEKNERHEGYEERIRNLGELLPLAKMAENIVEDTDGLLKQLRD